MISSAAGVSPRLDDSAGCAAGRDHVWKAREQGLNAFGDRFEANRYLRHDSERALAAHDGSNEVVARRETGSRSEMNHTRIRQHEFKGENVVGRRSVLEGVWAARVFSNVTPDRASQLTGRIRCVEKAVLEDHLGEIRVDDTRLDDRVAILDADLQNPVHSRALDDHRSIIRNGAAGQTGAGAPGHERHTVGAADRHDAAHFFPAVREHDRERFRRVKRQPVTLVNEQLLGAVEAVGRTHDGFEFTD